MFILSVLKIICRDVQYVKVIYAKVCVNILSIGEEWKNGRMEEWKGCPSESRNYFVKNVVDSRCLK